MFRRPEDLPRCLLAVATLVTLAACHHDTRQSVAPISRSSVSYQPVADNAATHYKLALDQSTTGADTAPDNPAPKYPASMLEVGRKPVDIDALLIVGRDGHVHEVRIAGAAADGTNAPFALAVAAATLHWRFTPFRITTWQDTPDGGSRRIAATPEPFSQRYRFHFAIVDGKPRVTTGVSG